MTKIGVCQDITEIDGLSLLGFNLYVQKGMIKSGAGFKATIVKDGKEIGVFEGTFGISLSGKKARSDMDRLPLFLHVTGMRDKLIGSTVYLDIDIDFWIPK